MSHRSLGLLLLAVAAAVAIIGLLVWLGAFRWFGRLPGDVRIERDGFTLFIPLTSGLLLSAAVSLALWIARRLLS